MRNCTRGEEGPSGSRQKRRATPRLAAVFALPVSNDYFGAISNLLIYRNDEGVRSATIIKKIYLQGGRNGH
jgi:hypothetical protein